ncbi:hypothetical protein IWQ47_002460 [Aquimarina sp. EL_43]|uniref:hypothetical protein n=1 Tax=unclassified Aquimarina TaxID=2627091 RepID=UPI0018C9A880|nr:MULTISPECIES: hypothetical protein [unclassified Aquimarina]MBG6130990.1 hypothetical protein [Aquimarina sp. EL_35]MBG6151449.1 hypothetical protein [Aquimarina sp. EL_32]MBG6169380.1 hypothetical protein [Aquimarina sp. EL_43]
MKINSNSSYFNELFKQKLESLKQSEDYHLVKELIPENAIEDKIRDYIKEELTTTFKVAHTLIEQDKSEKANAFLFQCIGSDIPPFIPSTCWMNGFSSLVYDDGEIKKKGQLFDSTGGFDLKLLHPLYDTLEDNEDLWEIDVYDDLKWVLIFKTFQLMAEAIEYTIQSDSFSKIPITTPFHFLATGGHDENKELLLLIE